MERKLTTPSICPKFQFIPQPNLKLDIFAKSFPTLLDTPPQTTPMDTPSRLEGPPPHSFPNFKTTTLLQSRVSSTPKRQSHIHSRALLKLVSFLIPKLPLAIDIHILSHPNKRVLESPHKKSLCSFSILLATCALSIA